VALVTDEDLALRASRDPRAFADLYARYLDPVHRYCYRRLGNRELAEDATSLVFSRALAAMSRYREGSFRSWLFAIAHNVIADHLRALRAWEQLDTAVDLAGTDPTPEELAITGEEATFVRGLLAQLAPDQRRVVELRLAGLTGPEIREALGRSRAWVDTTQHRAVLRLREVMGIAPATKEVDDAGR
jgi:RNA polymerase sigma factor (sigma-70 family)